MPATIDLNDLIRTLVSFGYPELQKRQVVASWGRTSNYAQVRWSDDDNEINIRINKNVRMWHQAGLTGLLSHELSHPAQSGSGIKEKRTDEDVITRGYATATRNLDILGHFIIGAYILRIEQ